MTLLHVTTFGGGVVLAGSPDARDVSELSVGDNIDLGPRGQIVPSSKAADYVEILDRDVGGLPLSAMYGITVTAFPQGPFCEIVGVGRDGSGNPKYRVFQFPPSGASSPITPGLLAPGDLDTFTPLGGGVVCTFVSMPYVDQAGVQRRPCFINLGARGAQNPRQAPGLYVIDLAPSGGLNPIASYDALGTGPIQTDKDGHTGGTKAKRLHFRGIAAYNNHLFGWGFDNSDATNGDGPNRLMFSNTGLPFKWGKDDQGAVTTDRDYTDSDAIIVGGGSEAIRAAVEWDKKLYIGTNRGLHYVAGYGRQSFLTDGAQVIKKSRNVIGPHAMIEGPDGLLYGVSTEGLWVYAGAAVEHVGAKLIDYRGRSPGWWDLIWFDPAASATSYPGQTNQDLVWMMSDPDTQQVRIVIPFCDATAGAGPGNDTVMICYHPNSGGFTRTVFSNVAYTHGTRLAREQTTAAARFFITPSASATARVRKYAEPTTNGAPPLPTRLSRWRVGPYAAFGPDGVGVYRKVVAVFSWDLTAPLIFPIIWVVRIYVDDRLVQTVTLNIAATEPLFPGNGDLWLFLDTGSVNNQTQMPLTRWHAERGEWVPVQMAEPATASGRAAIPIAFTPTRGSRLAVEFEQALSADRRWQFEGLGIEPALVREAV